MMKTPRSASDATAEIDSQTTSSDDTIPGRQRATHSLTFGATPVASMEAATHDVITGEPAHSPSKSSNEKTPTSGSDPTSPAEEPAPKIIHQNWERVCHAVPKCDACEKKCGQTGVLQRCISCTWQICKACVDKGKLEQKAKSAHPALHIMDPETVDWSPATKAEKAAQAKRRKGKNEPTETASKSIAAESKPTTRAKASVQLKAVRGVGLRKVVVETEEGGSSTSEHNPADVHVESPSYVPGLGRSLRPRKRPIPPLDDQVVSQVRENSPR